MLLCEFCGGTSFPFLSSTATGGHSIALFLYADLCCDMTLYSAHCSPLAPTLWLNDCSRSCPTPSDTSSTPGLQPHQLGSLHNGVRPTRLPRLAAMLKFCGQNQPAQCLIGPPLPFSLHNHWPCTTAQQPLNIANASIMATIGESPPSTTEFCRSELLKASLAQR